MDGVWGPMGERAVAALVSTADRALVERLLARGGAARAAVAGDPLSTALVDVVLAGDDETLRLALTGNPAFVRDHRERALDLAGTGEPRICAALLGNPASDERLRATVFEVIDPADPSWRSPDGFVSGVLARMSDRVDHEVAEWAGRSPFGEIDREYLRTRRDSWDRQLAVLGNLWRHHGRTEVIAALAEVTPHPFAAEVVGAALAEPERDVDEQLALTERIEALRHPQWSVRLLRLADEAHARLADKYELDWSEVLAAHRERPFSVRTLRDLVGRADCPEHFLLGLVDRKAPQVAGRELLTPLAKRSPGVSLAVLAAFVRAPRGSGDADAALASVVHASLEQGTVTVDEALEVLTPLATLCGVLEKGDGLLNQAVGARVEAALGSDPGAWRALWKLLPRWRQPLARLLTAAADAGPGTPEWAKPEPAPSPGRRQHADAPKITAPRAALYALFGCCSVQVRLDVLPILDELARFDLLARHQVEPAFSDGVAAGGDRADQLMLAANRGLDDSQKARLLALGDPDVHAQFYVNLWAIPRGRLDRWRRDLAIGVRRRSGDDLDDVLAEPDLVRMSDQLRRYVFRSHLDYPGVSQWHTLSPLVESGQAEIAVEVLRAVQVPTGLLQLRLLLAVARRDGVPAAREVLGTDLSDRQYRDPPWDPPAFQAAEAALGAAGAALGAAGGDADDGEALRRLVEVVAEWSSPARWIARLRELSSFVSGMSFGGFELIQDDLLEVGAERYTMDWSLLGREHERLPFHDHLVNFLRALHDPALPPPWNTPWDDLDAALVADETTLDRILATGRPAARVLRAGSEHGWWRRPDNPLPGLCADLLGADLDAWQLAGALLDEFAGTVPELLGSAATATAARASVDVAAAPATATVAVVEQHPRFGQVGAVRTSEGAE
ncbi:hypothetical protein GCM10022225_15590 [Plantactinospora mayteni]|uniref:Uncharacterized protein n=2 Tax=Plantactinospora mayteni TaxID=566021 RepID=A0ABQ4EFY7_9ACTN|nr:hypothetical protein Pma05_02060 [Plantactinospora mayteni]